MGRDLPSDFARDLQGTADTPQNTDAPRASGRRDGDGFVLTREFYAAHELASFRDDAELYDVERVDEPGRMDCPADALERFSPDRAGPAEVSADEAKRHITDNKVDRPWLVKADSASPEVQRIFTALGVLGRQVGCGRHGWMLLMWVRTAGCGVSRPRFASRRRGSSCPALTRV